MVEDRSSGERSEEALRALSLATVAITSAERVETVIQTALEVAETVLEFDECSVFVREGASFELVASTEPTRDCPGLIEATSDRAHSVLIAEPAATEHNELLADDVNSALCVPIDDYGVFLAVSTVPGYYDSTDRELLEVLVGHVAAAIGRIRAEHSDDRTLEALCSVVAELESHSTQTAVFETVTTELQRILGADWAGVVELGKTEFVATTDADDPPIDAHSLRSPAGQPTGTDLDPRRFRTAEAVGEAMEAEPWVRSAIVVPIGESAVCAVTSSDEDAFSALDLEAVKLLAAAVSETCRRVETKPWIRKRQQKLQLLKQVQSRVLRHNIRNDLTVIAGAANLARAEDDGVNTHLEIIETKASGLLATTDKVRQIEGVIDRGRQQAVLDFAGILETVADRARQQYPEATLEVTTPGPTFVTTHPDLELVMWNLVENGIVHHPGEPAVEIDLERRDTRVRCTVTDDGCGIPESELDVLEQEAETALEHGSGAGLWLVTLIVEQAGGTISFDTSPAGTTVAVDLPLAGES